MKICFISPLSYKLFHPNNERILAFSGAEIQIYQLGMELAKDKDFKVSFIVGDFYPEQPRVEKFRIQIYKVFKYYQRIPLIDALVDFYKLWQVMKEIDADIYLIRGAGSLAGKSAFLAKKILRKKFIFSSAHDRESNLEFFKKNNFYTNWLFKYALKGADIIICQHGNQKQFFKKNFGLEALVIKSIYSISELKTANYNQREFILWVSRLENWKQPEVFLNLAKNFKKEKFLLITSSNASEFKKRLKIPQNLEILENIPFEKMDDYFQKAKIFINTSLSEGFPNTFVQATKNKVPIVSLNVNPDNFLENYKCGFFSRGNINQMINQIETLIGNQKLWQEMAENGYRYARENHDIKKIVEKYKEIFKKLK